MNKLTIYFGIILLLSISIYFLFSSNSQKSNNDDFNFGAFHIKIPEHWKKIEFDGIDSYVGGITNGNDSLTFDYGWYSYDFSYEDGEKQLFATDTINGKIALITKPKETGNGTIGIYIEKAYKENRFNLIGKNIADEDLILEIFKSIKFKDSDTTLNSESIGFSNKITPYSGRSLFYANCAACHHKNKNMTGPAFGGIKELEFKKWILDSKDLNEIDKTEFGISYHRKAFGKLLTENEIEKLIEYSKSE
ncbi:cytochrome c [Flavobacteriaceae bacterium GSB9]|nr:cytochrome c [Flavobacteriaceae bacterium GSB9]UKM66190.2 cytochrome c [Flavobacteriaceae bacterium GSB9]